MIMHVITNFTASAGAETMLARLLRQGGDQRALAVSLLDVSNRNRTLSSNQAVEFVPLRMNSPLAIARAATELVKLIRSERPTTVLCWMYHAMVVGTLAAKWANCDASIIWNVRQSLDDPASLSRSTRVAIAAAKRLSRFADGIIYNSSRAQQLHTDHGFANRNTVVISNGFDLPPLVLPEPKKARTFGIAARFHPQKDYATFFRAAAQVLATHPEARFVAAGKGVSWQNPHIAALAQQAGLAHHSVDLRDEIADMAGFYQSIDFLVLSSRTEGFPNVVAEAMSYGRPVIATDVGDAAVIVGDSGFVVPPRDDRALAAAMRAVLDLSPDDYADYASRARTRVERNYSLDAAVSKYGAFLKAESEARFEARRSQP
jgi:glycosyltransferase involved in cell wall biosynthesis